MALASRHPGAWNYLGGSYFVENLCAPVLTLSAGFNFNKPEADGYLTA